MSGLDLQRFYKTNVLKMIQYEGHSFIGEVLLQAHVSFSRLVTKTKTWITNAVAKNTITSVDQDQ